MFARMDSQRAVLAVLAFLCAIVPASGIIVEKELSIMADGGTVKDIETFGFLAGGYAEWDIHSEPRGTSDPGPRTFVLGCKDVDLYVIDMTAANSCVQHTTFQNSTVLEKCYVFEVPREGQTQQRVEITSTGRIAWGILMCGDGEAVRVARAVACMRQQLGRELRYAPGWRP